MILGKAMLKQCAFHEEHVLQKAYRTMFEIIAEETFSLPKNCKGKTERRFFLIIHMALQQTISNFIHILEIFWNVVL